MALGYKAVRCYISFGLFYTLALFPLPSLFPFPTFHTELKSTGVAFRHLGRVAVGISVVGWDLLHTGHFLPALPVASPQNSPSAEALLGLGEGEIPQTRGLSSPTSDGSCSPRVEANPPGTTTARLSALISASTLLELSFSPLTIVVFCDYLCCLPRIELK